MTAHVSKGGPVDLSGAELAAIVIGPAGLLATIGGAIKWLRLTLADREKYVDERVQSYIGKLETQIETLRSEAKHREERLGRLEAGTRILLVEVARIDPSSETLRRVGAMLNMAAGPPSPDLPDIFADLVDELHHRERGARRD